MLGKQSAQRGLFEADHLYCPCMARGPGLRFAHAPKTWAAS